MQHNLQTRHRLCKWIDAHCLQCRQLCSTMSMHSAIRNAKMWTRMYQSMLAAAAVVCTLLSQLSDHTNADTSVARKSPIVQDQTLVAAQEKKQPTMLDFSACVSTVHDSNPNRLQTAQNRKHRTIKQRILARQYTAKPCNKSGSLGHSRQGTDWVLSHDIAVHQQHHVTKTSL